MVLLHLYGTEPHSVSETNSVMPRGKTVFLLLHFYRTVFGFRIEECAPRRLNPLFLLHITVVTNYCGGFYFCFHLHLGLAVFGFGFSTRGTHRRRWRQLGKGGVL